LSKEIIASGGLASTHFQQRVINVSNAPPVSLKREKTGEWEIKQGSGGLVSAVDPVMSKDKENVKDKDEKNLQPTTNTLGLPLLKQAHADVLFHVLADEPDEKEQDAKNKAVRYFATVILFITSLLITTALGSDCLRCY
uniref:PGG domain-containing protein n=1 Tax=Gongylonema pulchrum TaxID=637853 RepID=A0A183ER88_9BILA